MILKWLTAGYIIVRGWCEFPNTFSNTRKFSTNQKESWSAAKTKLQRQISDGKRSCKKDNRIILWFEVDDTGCGMNLKNSLTRTNKIYNYMEVLHIIINYLVFSFHFFLRNWSKQMGVRIWKLWASWHINNSIVSSSY